MEMMTKVKTGDQFASNGKLCLNVSAFEQDLHATRRKRLSWEVVCRKLTAHTSIDGAVPEHWRAITDVVCEQHGRPSNEAFIKIRNKQPVEGFAAMLLASYRIGRLSPLGRELVKAEQDAIAFSKRIAKPSAEEMPAEAPADEMDMGADELVALKRAREAEIAGKCLPENAHKVGRLHVANAAIARNMAAEIVAEGPRANRYAGIMDALREGRGR